ncbi:MAG: histidine phosphatase family protein [Aureispira sp.]|nr:histidine phosphatase family protein [Aureispira sp.]
MKHLYFIRHGQTEFNVKGIVQGRGVDSDLNSVGKQQRDAFFENYQQKDFDSVITSTLKRTIQTVEPFINSGLPHHKYSELDEISWGIYEGKVANKALHQDYKNLIKSWGEGDYHVRIENGDSAQEMGDRLNLFVQQAKLLEGENLLICTHGGCMAFLMTILQNQPLSAMPQYRHANTGLCKFWYDGQGFHLLLQNDTSHLPTTK